MFNLVLCPFANRHLTIVEGFMHRSDPRSYAVGSMVPHTAIQTTPTNKVPVHSARARRGLEGEHLWQALYLWGPVGCRAKKQPAPLLLWAHQLCNALKGFQCYAS